MRAVLWILLWTGTFFCSAEAIAEESRNPRGIEFFEKHIRPVLVKRCYECHSAESGKAQGGLRLDTRNAAREGGDSGHAIVPGNLEDSLLLEAIRYESFEMPPEGKLPDETIERFAEWIRMGAPDPRGGKSEVAKTEDSNEPLWSLARIVDPPPPVVDDADWPATGIDRFLLARRQAAGVDHVADADPPTLLRRVSFDLVGLPPAPEDVQAFAADPSPQAYAEYVDRLLVSPEFGERWARHWLDVARYAESNGRDRDVLMPHAWRYRDWTIDAFNADMPYDRFIAEQVAGDLLPADTPEERDRQWIATGFLAIGAKSLTGGGFQMDLVDEQIDVVSRAFLGLTVSCARCHDHKFDPLPTRDYYSLAGVFLSTDTRFGGGLRRPKDTAGKTDELLVLGENAAERVQRLKQRQKTLADLNKRQQTLSNQRKKLRGKLPEDWNTRLKEIVGAEAREGEEPPTTSSDEDQRILEYAKLVEELGEIDERLKEVQGQEPPEIEFAVGVREANKPADCRIHIGGERGNLGEAAPRGFLTCVELDGPAIPKNGSGRLQLARWLTHEDNPLTARVAVNRVWLHLFGRGLVPTVDNFGAGGEKPTHPLLLDYLARRFVEDGWSVKRLIRRIVLSHSYRLSSDFDQACYEADPENRLYWRMSRRRLEAEALRDAMLAASGRLKPQRPLGSAVARIGDGEVGRGINTAPLNEPFPFRSVYLPILRGIVPEFLKTFDFPEPSNVQGQRDVTNVPAQSLFLMNNPFVVEQAQGLAERLERYAPSPQARVQRAYQICFGRPASGEEAANALDFLGDADADTWTTFCQAFFASAEFRYLD